MAPSHDRVVAEAQAMMRLCVGGREVRSGGVGVLKVAVTVRSGAGGATGWEELDVPVQSRRRLRFAPSAVMGASDERTYRIFPRVLQSFRHDYSLWRASVGTFCARLFKTEF